MEDPAFLNGLLMALVLSFIGYLVLSVTWNHRETLPFQFRLFLTAMAIRYGMALVIYQFGLVNVLKDEDGSGWVIGVAYQNQWRESGLILLDMPGIIATAFQGHHRGYYYLVGLMFYYTNTPGRLPAAALNCFFGALTTVWTYRIARSLFSPFVASRVGWWTCLFPSLIIWSAQTVKEPVVIFLETVALYSCVQLRRITFSPRHLVLAATVIVFLIPFRFYAAYIVLATAAFSLLLPHLGNRKATNQFAVSLLALNVAFLILFGWLASKEVQSESFDLQRLQEYRESLAADSGSGVKVGYDMRTPLGFSASVLVGTAHLLLAPFPWQLLSGSLRMLLVGPEMMVWWWLFFVGVVPGLWHALRTCYDKIQPILFFLLGLGMLYSMTFGNVGLVYRQRAQLLPWLLIFAAVGVEQRILRLVLVRKAQRQAANPRPLRPPVARGPAVSPLQAPMSDRLV